MKLLIGGIRPLRETYWLALEAVVEEDLTSRSQVHFDTDNLQVVSLLSPEDRRIMDDAVQIVKIAQDKSVVVRVLGALAVRIHSHSSADLFVKLGRLGNSDRVFTDVDFVGYGKQKGKLRALFEDQLKFRPEIWSLLNTKDRIIYAHPDVGYKVDVFLDRLSFSHEVNFGSNPKNGRLELDFPSISLADLMLEKLQIHEINEKDVKDIIILLHEHSIRAGQDRESIDGKYVASALANDWGFWYDATTNLNKVGELAADYAEKGLISNEILADVQSKITELRHFIEAEPKSKNWIQRQKIGIEKQWWRDVEEISR